MKYHVPRPSDFVGNVGPPRQWTPTPERITLLLRCVGLLASNSTATTTSHNSSHSKINHTHTYSDTGNNNPVNNEVLPQGAPTMSPSQLLSIDFVQEISPHLYRSSQSHRNTTPTPLNKNDDNNENKGKRKDQHDESVNMSMEENRGKESHPKADNNNNNNNNKQGQGGGLVVPFDVERDLLSRLYVLTTTSMERKFLLKVFPSNNPFRHPATAASIEQDGLRERLKEMVQLAIENELGALEWAQKHR